MNDNPVNMPDIDPEVPPHAVSVFGADSGAEEFPVLKAFQQYIDAEQAKARKRLVTMGIFFGVLTFAVIAVFVSLLIRAGDRNQQLNDRLVEYVMRERDRQTGPVVVQPQAQTDNSAILALTDKLEAMRKELSASQERATKAEQAAADAAAEAAKPKGPTPEEQEIAKLKALLKAEKDKAAEKAALEKEMQRKLELEAYYRKHYPELYAPKKVAPARVADDDEYEDADEYADEDEAEVVRPKKARRRAAKAKARPARDVIDEILDDDSAITYFDEEDAGPAEAKGAAKPEATPAPKPNYEIPVEIKGGKAHWRIPQ